MYATKYSSFLACIICALCGPAMSFDVLKTVQNALPASAIPTASIYYDTLDQKCIDFFSNTFSSVYGQVGKFLDVNLVPFGKAKMTDGKLSCPDNAVECYAIKVHTCAFSHIKTTADKMKFLVCTMSTLKTANIKNLTNETYLDKKCVDFPELNVTSLNTCVENLTDSSPLLKTYADETAALGTVESWPVITINKEKYDAAKSQQLVSNFAVAFCGHVGDYAKNNALLSAYCQSVSPNSTNPAQSAAAVNSITYWPIVIATIFSALFAVKLG